jgi:hypothetical protein
VLSAGAVGLADDVGVCVGLCVGLCVGVEVGDPPIGLTDGLGPLEFGLGVGSGDPAVLP